MADLLDPPVADGYPYPSKLQTYGPDGSYTWEGPTLAGTKMPGQWLLTKGARTFGLQKQPSGFMSGGGIVRTGDPLVDIEYEVRIWESGTMSLFRQLMKTLLKAPGPPASGAIPERAAMTIEDAILGTMGITKVVVASVDPPKNPLVSSGGKGPWVGHVTLMEWRPPIPVQPIVQQVIRNPGAVNPTAAANLATAQAGIAQAATDRQAKAAAQLLSK